MENITPDEAISERTIFITPIDRDDLEVVEALVDSVMNGAIGEQAGETTSARVEQTLFAVDVEIRILLAGEARRRQVLGGRRAPHRETDLLAVLLLKLAVGIQNLGGQIVGEPGAVDDLTGALAFRASAATSAGSSSSSSACRRSQAPALSNM